MNQFFGEYGGQFVAETLIPALDELDENFEKFRYDSQFIDELSDLLKNYAGRPTPIYFAQNLSKKYNVSVYLKREDLLHTGAHKINNSLGQALLAKKMGKNRIIAETGAGQHGVATATAAALFNLKCGIYMGSIDAERQKINVQRMKMLGSEVFVVDEGSRTLKDAVSAALRDWITNVKDTHYILGSALGPYPFPKIVAHFQSIIGKESRKYFEDLKFMPDYIIACVGGGSNSIGIFKGFMDLPNVKFIGVEAGGISDEYGKHASRMSYGKKGIFQGSFSYVLTDEQGQISPVHSVSAGLDYAGVGPEHAYLKDQKIAEYALCRDVDALDGCLELCKTEGILPALESSHALGYFIKNHKLFEGKKVLINLSGRGDKDLGIILKNIGGEL